jgi:hypothetical protein
MRQQNLTILWCLQNKKCIACPQEGFIFEIHHKARWLKRGYPMKFADATQNPKTFI